MEIKIKSNDSLIAKGYLKCSKLYKNNSKVDFGVKSGL